MKKAILIVFCLLLVSIGLSQTAIGKFRAHIPMHSFFSVAVSDDYVYAATDNGLMLLDLESLGQERPDISNWTKVDGLSDISIKKIFYDDLHQTLIVSYENGNLDIIKDDKLYNMRDIRDKQITGSKIVSHIRSYNDNTYLVYPFGIVSIDLNDLVIEDTWFTKSNGTQYTAKDIAMDDSKFYVSTSEGIFSISKTNNNPANFTEWQLDSTTTGIEFDHLISFGNRIFANKNGNPDDEENPAGDTIYTLDQGEWVPTTFAYYDIRSLNCCGDELVICSIDYVDLFDHDLNRTYHASLYHPDVSFPSAQEAVAKNGQIWVADLQSGLLRAVREFYDLIRYTENGPYSLSTQSICSHQGVTVIVPGAPKGSAFGPSYNYPSVSWFANQKWDYNAYEFYEHDPLRKTYDLSNVIVNPNNESEWYIASWGNGLFKCTDKHITHHYTPRNSLLDSTANGQCFIYGLAYDKKGNLWMTNSQCENMLKMMEPDGTWHKYNISRGVLAGSYENVVANHLLIDSRGYKWINYPRGNEFNHYNLVAFSDNGTYDDLSDDKFARVDMNATSEVSSTTVYCIAEDLDGEIWIGTDKGIKVINFPSKIFEGDAYPRNILLEQDGYVSVLFEYEEITAIAVDGANRKWIGTSKAGVFLMSEDGQQQLMHFTENDDPLFSSQITSICIDQISGEVFFGTAKGLISYRGTATGSFEKYEDLPVYPNPVRHDYSGPVAINGLKANSLCKITDATGKLVWQGVSNGGELIWYCVDHFGNRPATGVYYVMSSDENGKEKIVTKFLFIH